MSRTRKRKKPDVRNLSQDTAYKRDVYRRILTPLGGGDGFCALGEEKQARLMEWFFPRLIVNLADRAKGNKDAHEAAHKYIAEKWG